MDTDQIYRHDGYIGMMEACRSGPHDLDSFLNKPLFEVPFLTRTINFVHSLPISSKSYATAAVIVTDLWMLARIGASIRRAGGLRSFFAKNYLRVYFIPRVQQINYTILSLTLAILNYKVMDKEFRHPLDAQKDFTKDCLRMITKNYGGVHASAHYQN